jgi:GTP-binding protein
VIALTKADLLDEKKRAKIIKALEKETGARVFPVSAPLEEGLEPLLDAIIQRLGASVEDDPLEAADERRQWSPL